jgi:hypothetical protein
MKLVGKFGLVACIVLSILIGLNNLNYFWLLPIITLQTLSYFLFHFKNFKFKKIDKRNNPFTKELPHHFMIQAFIVFLCFGVELGLNAFCENEVYA